MDFTATTTCRHRHAVTDYPTGCNAGNSAISDLSTAFNVPPSSVDRIDVGHTAVCFRRARERSTAPARLFPTAFRTALLTRFTSTGRWCSKSTSRSLTTGNCVRITRISKVFGNFEGAFRNDNGQSDPGISSLFDFTHGNFNQLGGQITPGVLNQDRQQVANGYFSYVFDHGMLKNLLGTGIAHPDRYPDQRTGGASGLSERG